MHWELKRSKWICAAQWLHCCKCCTVLPSPSSGLEDQCPASAEVVGWQLSAVSPLKELSLAEEPHYPRSHPMSSIQWLVQTEISRLCWPFYPSSELRTSITTSEFPVGLLKPPVTAPQSNCFLCPVLLPSLPPQELILRVLPNKLLAL